MNKPAGHKYALFPNFWEFLNLIASTLGVGLKEIKDNQKTFYNIGFLPISDNEGRNAVDILKHIVKNAQKRKILGIFHKGPWKSILGIQEDNKKIYTDLAEKCICDYRLQIIIYEPKQKFFLREYGLYLAQYHPDSFSPVSDQDWEKLFPDFLIYRENHRIRDICINIVCNFLGEEFREKCTEKYDKLFQQTLFSPSDYHELLNKDLKDWDDKEKALAFSIPFSAFSKNERYRLYSEVLNRIASTPDRLAHNGSKHSNIWIDQYTELGHTFNWMMDKKMHDFSKQVLRKEKCKRNIDFGQLESLFSKIASPEILNSLEESFDFKSDERKKELKENLSIKGIGLLLNHSLNIASSMIPEDALTKIENADISTELTHKLDEIASGSGPNSPEWIAASTLFPFFGATGYLCKEKLQPHIPKIKKWVKEYPGVVETILRETVSHIKDNHNIKNHSQENKK